MKRSPIRLADVATWETLTEGFHRAASGKRHSRAVVQFAKNFDGEIGRLRADILAGTVEVGHVREFRIFDPKPRVIRAPCFRERVLHHALMLHLGPVLDRSLIDDTFACREGKGSLAAVLRAQCHSRRFPWFVKIDIRSYFASIHHETLKVLLRHRLKDRPLLALLDRIIDAHSDSPGRGLPIGALTSQNFANFYLSRLDRLLLEDRRVRGIVRYMDDCAWWCDDRPNCVDTLVAAREFADRELKVVVKSPADINRSVAGLSFCGFRVWPGILRLSPRRRQRYVEARRKWETAFARGEIDARGLQMGYSAALAITAHADALAWRREQLHRSPPSPGCGSD